MDERTILWLRMRRQHLLEPADEAQYLALYRDMQPGFSVYWNGFGQPPVLSFRAAFDDLAFNRRRQLGRELVKGRFGGNLGWIVPEDMGAVPRAVQKAADAPERRTGADSRIDPPTRPADDPSNQGGNRSAGQGDHPGAASASGSVFAL